MKSRQWLLASRPTAEITRDNFTMVERDIGEPDLARGQILVKHQIFACAPAMRGWMQADRPSFVPGIDPGDPIITLGGAKVIRSSNPAYPEGARIFCVGAWQEYQVLDPSVTECRVIEDDLSLADALGIYSMNALTAYFGLLRVGEPKEGETLVVSGAAGSTGSIVVQIGKILGLRVIGIAGGAEKCGWVLNDYGADAVIDYKSENVAERLAALCPKRIDIFFDNVGGETLDAAMGQLAQGARVVLCGATSQYSHDSDWYAPKNYFNLVYKQATMSGFYVGNFAARYEEAVSRLAPMVVAGTLKYAEDIHDGLDKAPVALGNTLSGDHFGVQLVKVSGVAG